MNWIKRNIAKMFSSKLETKLNAKKLFEEIYNDLGVFKYDDEGFTINYESFSTSIKWVDITQLNVYKRDQFVIDRVEMEIVVGDKSLTISEDLRGWFQFVIKTKEIFSTIPKDWDINIVLPPFETNFTTIYIRDEYAKPEENKQKIHFR